MKKTLKLPFILNGGNKTSFKLLNEKDMKKKVFKQNAGLINYLEKLFFENKENNLRKNKENINYVKATTTKEYYKNLSNKI